MARNLGQVLPGLDEKIREIKGRNLWLSYDAAVGQAVQALMTPEAKEKLQEEGWEWVTTCGGIHSIPVPPGVSK